MKKRYKLEKKKRDYTISSINNNTVKIAIQILESEVMRKCRVNEVPAPVVALAKQCMEGVQFKWFEFLCKEFLEIETRPRNKAKCSTMHDLCYP